MKNWLQWAGMAILLGMVLFCLFALNRQAVIIKGQSATISQLIENDKNGSEQTIGLSYIVVDSENKIVDIVDILRAESERISRLESKETISPFELSNEVTSLSDRVNAVLSQIAKLDKDKVTENDFNKWVQKLELLVNNSLVELSKPENVPPVRPMPNTSPVIQSVALSNSEKEAVVRMAKGEIFKQFEESGYGKFVGDKFVLRKGFFGAEILAGDEWQYNLEK